MTVTIEFLAGEEARAASAYAVAIEAREAAWRLKQPLQRSVDDFKRSLWIRIYPKNDKCCDYSELESACARGDYARLDRLNASLRPASTALSAAQRFEKECKRALDVARTNLETALTKQQREMF